MARPTSPLAPPCPPAHEEPPAPAAHARPSAEGHSPADEPGHHGRPGDTAGAASLGLPRVILPAAAHADQVSHEEEEVQAQAEGSHQPQEQQRLKRRSEVSALVLWGAGGLEGALSPGLQLKREGRRCQLSARAVGDELCDWGTQAGRGASTKASWRTWGLGRTSQKLSGTGDKARKGQSYRRCWGLSRETRSQLCDRAGGDVRACTHGVPLITS